MNRKEFIAGTGALLGAALVPSTARAATADEADAIKQLVKDYYSIFYVDKDAPKYRALLTSDYLLLEEGEVMDAAADIADMPPPDIGYQRKDAFEFHSTKIQGDVAWTVYTLKSDVVHKKGEDVHHVEFLETMILRRTGGRWLVALLHSTKIAPPVK